MHRELNGAPQFAGRPSRIPGLPVFIAAVFLAASGLAQVDLSGLSGTVLDSAGRSLPGAHIVAVQSATGLRREAVSSESGSYTIPDLPIGVYRVTCTAPALGSPSSTAWSRRWAARVR